MLFKYFRDYRIKHAGIDVSGVGSSIFDCCIQQRKERVTAICTVSFCSTLDSDFVITAKESWCGMSFIRKKWKASYTVEAAFIVPILLGAMLLAMLIGLNLYQDIKGEQEQEKIMQMWQVKDFYKYQIVDEVIDNES